MNFFKNKRIIIFENKRSTLIAIWDQQNYFISEYNYIIMLSEI